MSTATSEMKYMQVDLRRTVVCLTLVALAVIPIVGKIFYPRLFTRIMLYLDEPTAGMGLEESARMVAFLRSLRGHYTILLVEHDMDMVFALADCITVLVAGRAIATGTPDAIRANAEVRRAYLGEEDSEVGHAER